MNLEPAAVLKRVERLGVLTTFVATAFACLWGVREATAVAAGGALALVNYGTLIWIVDRAILKPAKWTSAWAALSFVARYTLLGLILYVILARWKVNAVAIIAGFSAPVVAIFVEWGIETYVVLFRDKDPARSPDSY